MKLLFELKKKLGPFLKWKKEDFQDIRVGSEWYFSLLIKKDVFFKHSIPQSNHGNASDVALLPFIAVVYGPLVASWTINVH